MCSLSVTEATLNAEITSKSFMFPPSQYEIEIGFMFGEGYGDLQGSRISIFNDGKNQCQSYVNLF